MTCWKCRKQNVCFIFKEFSDVAKKTYPWWEPNKEALAEFVYGHCTQADLKNDS